MICIFQLENILEGDLVVLCGIITCRRAQITLKYCKVLYTKARIWFGWATSDTLTYINTRYDKTFGLDQNFNSPDDADTGYFVHVDLQYTKDFRKISLNISFCSHFIRINATDSSNFLTFNFSQ